MEDPYFQDHFNYNWVHDKLNKQRVDIDPKNETLKAATFLPFDYGAPNGAHLEECTVVTLETGLIYGNA